MTTRRERDEEGRKGKESGIEPEKEGGFNRGKKVEEQGNGMTRRERGRRREGRKRRW